MIVDITNEIYTKLDSELSNVTVLPDYPSTTPIFPCVVIKEMANTQHIDTIDSSGSQHCDITIEINIFSNAENKRTQAKGIRDEIDSIMDGMYGMNREHSGEVPNYSDTNIYRYVLRYSGVIDKNKKIHRG